MKKLKKKSKCWLMIAQQMLKQQRTKKQRQEAKRKVNSYGDSFKET